MSTPLSSAPAPAAPPSWISTVDGLVEITNERAGFPKRSALYFHFSTTQKASTFVGLCNFTEGGRPNGWFSSNGRHPNVVVFMGADDADHASLLELVKTAAAATPKN